MPDSLFHRVAQKFGVMGRTKAGPVAVATSIFGKHAAWNDHIPELSIDHDRLAELKSILYDGITCNVENGEWDKLAKSNQLQPYGHTFLWSGGGDPVAGRCWYSRDGKGRDRYPMMAAAMCIGESLGRVVRETYPVLNALQEACVVVDTADQVVAAQATSQRLLYQRLIESRDKAPSAEPDGKGVTAYLAMRPEMGPDRIGLLRVLYDLDRERQESKSSTSKSSLRRAVTLRVPACAESPTHAAELWTRFLIFQIGPRLPLLILVPDSAAWVDALIGPAVPSHLFSMRAPPEVVPFTTQIPYSLDSEFLNRTEKKIEHSIESAAIWLNVA